MYSDPISHALSFAAKQLAANDIRAADELSYPANLAVLLARFDCEESVVVAAVAFGLLTLTRPIDRPEMARRIGEKFGPIVRSVAYDALGPDPVPQRRSLSRTWESTQAEVLEHFADAEPKSIDVRIAAEIIACGAWVADVRRLGPEYLPQVAPATGEKLIWWFRSFAETIEQNEAWQRPSMLTELRLLTTKLNEAIKNG